MPLKILLFIDCRLNTTLTRIEAKEKCTNIETLSTLKNNMKINLIDEYARNNKNVYEQLQNCMRIFRNCELIHSNFEQHFNELIKEKIENNLFKSLNEFINLKLKNLLKFILFDIDKLFRDTIKLDIINNKKLKVFDDNNNNNNNKDNNENYNNHINYDNNDYNELEVDQKFALSIIDYTKIKDYNKSKRKLNKIFGNLSNHFIDKYSQYNYNEKAKKTEICDLLLRMDIYNLFNIIIYWCYH